MKTYTFDELIEMFQNYYNVPQETFREAHTMLEYKFYYDRPDGKIVDEYIQENVIEYFDEMRKAIHYLRHGV